MSQRPRSTSIAGPGDRILLSGLMLRAILTTRDVPTDADRSNVRSIA